MLCVSRDTRYSTARGAGFFYVHPPDAPRCSGPDASTSATSFFLLLQVPCNMFTVYLPVIACHVGAATALPLTS